MRIRELVLAIVLAGCVSNPDPRVRHPEDVIHDGRGGWIVVTTATGTALAGELLAIDDRWMYVLVGVQIGEDEPPRNEAGGERWKPRDVLAIALANVSEARLYEYQSDAPDFAAWGVIGTLATISNGFFLVFTAPAWLLTSSLAGSSESQHMILQYPGAPWASFIPWARFPQGLPPNVSPEELVNRHALARRLPAP